MRCTTVSLQKKEIINLCDGSRLGFATDVEFDPKCARLLSLLVPCGTGGFLGLGKTEYLVIPWEKIECFGEDTVLVRLLPTERHTVTLPPCKRGCDPEKAR